MHCLCACVCLLSQLEGLLSRLNGFLIPGGAANLRPGHDFFDTAKRVLDFAIKSNDEGDYFPVLGICLGFETLMVATAGELLHNSRMHACTAICSAGPHCQTDTN